MKRSIKEIALIVALGTFLSKTGGMFRQLTIAGAFGIDAAYDAYNYAYIIPGFFLVLIGGINGPFHNAIVSILSKESQKEAEYITNSITTIISSILFLISGILFIAADPLIKILGPGLSSEVHQIAVIQLQIMAPITFFSGLIGIGFGTLNTRDQFFIPSISPLLSSLVLIIFVSIFWIQESEFIPSFALGLKGEIVIALATLIGAILQWGIQIPLLIKKGFTKIRFIFDWNNKGVKDILKIIIPATFSSGMLQFNVFTDLFFASGIAGAAAGLSYANFIIQAPLGLISNTLLIPLLPTFSKLKDQSKKNELIKKIGQGLNVSSASMICLSAIIISLSNPIIELIYQRGAFDKDAVDLVSALLIAYGIGMPAYLGRDLLVRVFYAIGDAKTPFKLSIIGIWLNIIFDWVLTGGPSPWGNQLPFNFGAAGIILATVLINFITCSSLLLELNSQIGKLPLKQWGIDSIKLLFAGIISGVLCWSTSSLISWQEDFINLFLEVSFCSCLGIIVFTLIGHFLKVKEVNEITKLIRRKIIRF